MACFVLRSCLDIHCSVFSLGAQAHAQENESNASPKETGTCADFKPRWGMDTPLISGDIEIMKYYKNSTGARVYQEYAPCKWCKVGIGSGVSEAWKFRFHVVHTRLMVHVIVTH